MEKLSTLPPKQEFEDLVGEALNALVEENMDWCNVVAGAWLNKHEIGVIQINYGYKKGADRYRALLSYLSTDKAIYNMYPAANLLKKYAITVHIHSGFKKIKTRNLGPGLKGGNPDMKGDFTVVDCRTLTGEGKENCRLLLEE